MIDRTRRSVLATAAAWIAAWPALALSHEAPKIFHGVGTVTEVDKIAGVLTVDHGDIPGLMEAMEMAYKVRPASLARRLTKGDKITFGVDGKTLAIVEIKKLARP